MRFLSAYYLEKPICQDKKRKISRLVAYRRPEVNSTRLEEVPLSLVVASSFVWEQLLAERKLCLEEAQLDREVSEPRLRCPGN